MQKKRLVLHLRITDFIAFLLLTAIYDLYGVHSVYYEVVFLALMVLSTIRTGRIATINRKNYYFLWGVLFTGACVFSALYSGRFARAFNGVTMFFETFLCGALLLQCYLKSREKVIELLKMIVIVSLLLVLELFVVVPVDKILIRNTYPVINANSLGMKMGLALTVTLWLRKEKYISFPSMLICVIIFAAMVFISGSRTYLAFTVGSVAMMIFFYQKNLLKKFRVIFVSLVVLVAGIFLVMSNETLYNMVGVRFEGLIDLFRGGEGDLSAHARQMMIRIALQYWREKPFFGYGINTYGLVPGKYSAVYAHDNYAELLFGVGLVGCLIYYSCVVWLILRLIKSLRTDRLQILSLSIMAMFPLVDIGAVTYLDEALQLCIAVFCAIASGQFEKAATVDREKGPVLWKMMPDIHNMEHNDYF